MQHRAKHQSPAVALAAAGALALAACGGPPPSSLAAAATSFEGLAPALRAAVLADAQHWPALAQPVQPPPSASALMPAPQFLRVTQGQAQSWLVWAGQDPWPTPGSQLWVSAERGVLRLHQGRIVALGQAQWQWHEHIKPQDWQAISQQSGQPQNQAMSGTVGAASFSFDREQQWLPQGPFAQGQRRMRQRWWGQPPAHRYLGNADALQWWVEWSEPSQSSALAHSGVAFSALDPQAQPARWVYGQQCLARSGQPMCLSWQWWEQTPASAQPPAAPAQAPDHRATRP